MYIHTMLLKTYMHTCVPRSERYKFVKIQDKDEKILDHTNFIAFTNTKTNSLKYKYAKIEKFKPKIAPIYSARLK